MGESPNEQLLKFTKAIIDNVESFDEKTGSIFTQSTTLKICVEGERNIIIDNPTAIHYIADATLKMMQQDDLNSIGNFHLYQGFSIHHFFCKDVP